MNVVTFQHGDSEYVVKPLTGFLAGLLHFLSEDVCEALTGFTWDDCPFSQKLLLMYFLKWHSATTINGQSYNPMELTKAQFDKFVQKVGNDSEFAQKWLDAYDQANMEASDPNVTSEEPTPDSES